MKIFSVIFVSLLIPTIISAENNAEDATVFPIMETSISSKFGKRKHPVLKRTRHHKGIDLRAPHNSHVRSIKNGKVIFAGTFKGYGKLISILHKNGYTSMYGHLNEILVNVGQVVTAGQLIGRVGETGLATGPHLHFEWRKDGKAIDPMLAFPFIAMDAEG